jgi:hypothetical protein
MPKYYDIDAAFMCPNRVCEIDISLTSSRLQRLASTMVEPFPALIHLKLHIPSNSRPAPSLALPDGFLGGSTPLLQSLSFYSIPFLPLPKLLLSATHLVRLELWNIPHSGYISPEAIVTSLAVLANLRILRIKFESPLSRPDRESRRPPPSTRSVLPALTHFQFHGVSEYLEGLVARINAPLLNSIRITFFLEVIFDIPQLAQFMRRTTTFDALDEVYVDFGLTCVYVGSSQLTQTLHEPYWLTISCEKLDWQLSSLEQVFTSFFPSIYTVEYLNVGGYSSWPSRWQDDIENMQWLEFFQQFTAVKRLFVSKELAQSIAFALQDLIGEGVTDVLPVLESLFLEEAQLSGRVREAIKKFVAARGLSYYPVVFSRTDKQSA